MRKLSLDMRTGLASAVALVAVLLGGCNQPAPPVAPLPDVPAPQAPAAATPPGASTEPASVAPAIAAPATAEKVAQPVAPDLASMSLATSSASKLSAPVDLRYQFDGDVAAGQWVTLHLAAIPRVAGSNLKVSIKDVAGIRTSAGPLNAQKVSATTAYRQQLSVSRLADGPTELRVLVTMDVDEGSAFSWFSVPVPGSSR